MDVSHLPIETPRDEEEDREVSPDALRRRAQRALKALTPQRATFARAVARVGRASLAYRTATGCEDKVACSDNGSKWLAHPETASAIAALRDVDALDLDLGPDSILRVAASMLVLDPLELVDDEGNARQMAEIPASVRTALQGVKMTSKTRRRGRETTVTETTTDYKLADKTKVLDMLMRHHGLLARDNMQAGLANAAGIAELLGKQGRNNSVEPGE